MYYSAEQAGHGGRQCIGAATSGGAHGVFTPEPTPIACNTNQGGATDPAGFKDADGTRQWLDLYKSYRCRGADFEDCRMGAMEGRRQQYRTRRRVQQSGGAHRSDCEYS